MKVYAEPASAGGNRKGETANANPTLGQRIVRGVRNAANRVRNALTGNRG